MVKTRNFSVILASHGLNCLPIKIGNRQRFHLDRKMIIDSLLLSARVLTNTERARQKNRQKDKSNDK